jgi:hypothetical protein
LVDQLRTIQLAALDVAPRDVKDSQWYKDFRTGVNNFNQTGKATAALAAERKMLWDMVCNACTCDRPSFASVLSVAEHACAGCFMTCRLHYTDADGGFVVLNVVAVAARTPSSANCQPGCISLDFLAGLAGLDSTCICLTNTITNVQHGLQATQQVSA